MVLRRAFMRLLYSRQRLKIVLLFFVFSAFGYLCMVGMGPFGLIQSSLSNERENQDGMDKPLNRGESKLLSKQDERRERRDSAPKPVFMRGKLGNYEPTEIPTPTGPGEQGQPVVTDRNSAAVQKANREYGFNTVASDMIAMNRTIPDTRPAECKNWFYPEKLPSTTVVVVFHNEGWSPLMRTVHSVLNRSPPELLKEVLMVDDFSVKDHLKRKLEEYIKQFNGKVRLVRNSKREGLIRSRSIGAQNALGDVVLFLDAHCEVNVNWLPPLLAPIAFDKRTLTVPVIDSIDMNTWAYHPQYGYGGGVDLFRGIFEWGLLYKESEITDKERKRRKYKSEPFQSPTHAGGLFAIDRRWFKQLGYYDDGLQIWGGENFELSFKVWQCGGSVENVPCSKVGHVYRNHMPYSFGGLTGPIVSTNYKRVAEVWMDEYKEYYYIREPFMRKRDAGDISAQKKIREENNCKSFKWFMENVAYDIPPQFPLLPPNVAWGEIVVTVGGNREYCIDTMGQPIPGYLGVSGCHHQGGNQLFRLNTKGQMATGEWIITANGHGQLQTGRYIKGTVDGPWEFDEKEKFLRHKESKQCVEANPDQSQLKLAQCKPGAESQRWTFKELNL